MLPILQPIETTEEKLRILSTELKVLPSLPATTNPSAGESCAVLGRGMDLVKSQYSVGWASSAAPTSVPPTASRSSPVIPSGPVLAIPVTGGPPVQRWPRGIPVAAS